MILHSANDGASWQAQTSGTTPTFRGVLGEPPQRRLRRRHRGTILHSVNDGASWQAQNSGTNRELEAVWGSGPNDVFVAGENGTILHSVNDGVSWQAQNSGTTQELEAVWGSGPKDVFAAGVGSVILHRNDPEPSIDGDAVFAVLTNNSLWEFGAAGWQHLLSPAGTILSVASVTDGAGQAVAFAITSDHNLWEHSGNFPGNGWQILSAGSFQSVSAQPISPGRPSSSPYSPTILSGRTTPLSAATVGATCRRPAPSWRPTP